MTEAELLPAFPFLAVIAIFWIVVPLLIATLAYWVVRLAVRHELARSRRSGWPPPPPVPPAA